jgi:ABC-type lipoprotein export system ATPase subunit
VDRPLVVVKGLAKHFGASDALREVDLTVQRGEFVVISGPSGAGKSTLLHLIAALEQPDTGTITVDGVELTHHHHLTDYRRQQVGLVFQLHNLIPNLNALENVQVAMLGTRRSRQDRKARAEELLDFVGLANKATSRPPTMSGGQRQRVAVARALANDPPLLLADEPTGSLDDASAKQVIDLFARLRADHGLTILAVSHDARLVAAADRVVTLSGGELHAG